MNSVPFRAHSGPVRDFVGYGRTTPDVRWPDGSSVAVNLVVNYEEGAEYSLPDGDGFALQVAYAGVVEELADNAVTALDAAVDSLEWAIELQPIGTRDLGDGEDRVADDAEGIPQFVADGG